MSAEIDLRPSDCRSLDPIREALDAATHADRVRWMRGLGKRELRALWELVEREGGLPLDVAYVHGQPEEVVIHLGQNSLPMFSSFQKRFCRRSDGTVQGYNHNSWLVSAISGPGHFTVRPAPEADELLFDYTELPPSVPAGFPPLQDNDGGTRKLVFGGLVDRLRRVSRHVTIGTALRDGKPENAWFMLVRETDPS